MVIQANMSPLAILETWEQTRTLFEKYDVPITEILLQDSIQTHTLSKLLIELNALIGSSSSTCVEGG